jgi:hypothetical protein
MKMRIDTCNILQSITPQRPKKECVDSHEQQQTCCNRWCLKKENGLCIEERVQHWNHKDFPPVW